MYYCISLNFISYSMVLVFPFKASYFPGTSCLGANGSGGADVTQASWERRVVQVEQSQSYKTDKKRFLGLYWVRANVIGEFAPLDRGESFDQRVLWSMVCHRDFPLTWLHRKAIKHSVVELYKEMTTIFRDGLREQIKGGCVSHISFDLWTDKFSTLKCHGKFWRGFD